MKWSVASLFLMLFMAKAQALSLKSGDILLQSVPCYLCAAVEDEERSPYSHMGILVSDHGQWNVLEAWDQVQETPLDQFISRRRNDTQTLVLRTTNQSRFRQLKSASLLSRFQLFEGKNYDADFLWDNRDELGEKYYCSEFVAKFMNPYLRTPMPTKPMHYEVHREFWVNYFHGNPPDGKPGISPGDFERSPLFRPVGKL